MIWKQQHGTSDFDYSVGIAADDDGNVYITGTIAGMASVIKFSREGILLWSRTLGTRNVDTLPNGISTSRDGSIYASGDTFGSIGGPNKGQRDAWLVKYSAKGQLVWTRQLGTRQDDGSDGVAVDCGGNVYISGYTLGSLGGAARGDVDPWLARYSSNGSLRWTRHLGTPAFDASYAIAADCTGIYVTGNTYGALGGTNQGDQDAWLAKYSPAGKQLWKTQIGSATYDSAAGIATDGRGDVYISGWTYGSLAGPQQAAIDAWVAKYKAMTQH